VGFHVRLAAGFGVLLLVAPLAAPAQPVPGPAPVPVTGRVVHGHLTVTIGDPARLTHTVPLTTEHRGGLTRIALDPSGAASPGVVPLGAIVVVVDPANRTTTLWSPTTRRYHVQHTGEVSFPVPTGAAARSPLDLFETFAFAINLTGRSLVGSTATDDFTFSWNAQFKGLPMGLQAKGTVQLSDDAQMVPMSMHLALQTTPVPPPPGISASPVPAMIFTVDYAADDISLVVPPAGDFVVPAGYVPVSTLAGVLMPTPPSAPSAPPMPSATPTSQGAR
jgi:hypothetical protein